MLSFSPDLLSFTIPLFPFLSFVYPCSLSLYLAVCRSPLAPSYQSYFLLSSNHISSHLCLFDFPNHYHRSPPSHRNTENTNLITNRNLYLHLYSLHLNTYSFHGSAPLSISTIITFTFISFPLSHGFKPFYTGLQKPPLSLITKSKSRRFCSTFPTDLHKIRSRKTRRVHRLASFSPVELITCQNWPRFCRSLQILKVHLVHPRVYRMRFRTPKGKEYQFLQTCINKSKQR